MGSDAGMHPSEFVGPLDDIGERCFGCWCYGKGVVHHVLLLADHYRCVLHEQRQLVTADKSSAGEWEVQLHALATCA